MRRNKGRLAPEIINIGLGEGILAGMKTGRNFFGFQDADIRRQFGIDGQARVTQQMRHIAMRRLGMGMDAGIGAARAIKPGFLPI